jgi:GNAT superfamily N-acetyltransferase
MAESLSTQMPGPKVVLTRLQTGCEMEFGDLVSMYREGFPESERKPVASLRRMLASEHYHFLLAETDGYAAGFAIVRVLHGGDASLLEYMAVVPSRRGQGLGRKMFLATAGALGAPPRTLLIEAESDRVDSPDRGLRMRRKQFYRSLGAREFEGLRWIMPPVAAALPPAMEMLVLTESATPVRREMLRQWLTDIYVEVYEQSADDPRIDTMLADLPDEVRLI